MWTDEQTNELKRLIGSGRSYAESAGLINAEFGTSYSRNACIGRGGRIGLACEHRPPLSRAARQLRDKTRWHQKGALRKEKRWAEKPSLADRARLLQERQEIGKRVMASCKSKTSPTYRNQLPRLGDMSKTELRAMLATAVINTAAMENQP